jgi:hypothetical protein
MISELLKSNQHWITTIGVLATLLALWISYRKMKGRIDRFREQALGNISIANLATTSAAVEELMRTDHGNKDKATIFL